MAVPPAVVQSIGSGQVDVLAGFDGADLTLGSNDDHGTYALSKIPVNALSRVESDSTIGLERRCTVGPDTI